jgi:uncharacterized RDD family membrane protein YckC
MVCPVCGFVGYAHETHCPQCGAQALSEEHAEEQQDLELPLDDTYSRFRERIRSKQQARDTETILWGGLLRRSCAFAIDLGVLVCFSLLLSYLTYVAYSVGMAAHQGYAASSLAPFWRLSLGGSLLLSGWYFVLFHGIAGKTVGKWLLGLRVVGRDQSPITYRQAFRRLIGYFFSAFLGLGFVWILISAERRGWHDYFAGTWVIRERVRGTA